MRVLDLGCGAGDVSMLAAELVGPTGVVIGIDRNPAVLSVARERSREANLKQVEFKEASLELLAERYPLRCGGRQVCTASPDRSNRLSPRWSGSSAAGGDIGLA